MIASPLTTIEGFSSLKEAAAALHEALKPYPSIEGVVIGLPLHMSGEESALSTLARQFGEVLGMRVMYWDERLTSKQVERTLRNSGMRRKKQAKMTDKLAAAAILQNYLDSQGGI